MGIFDIFSENFKKFAKKCLKFSKNRDGMCQNIPREIPGNLRRIPGISREKYSNSGKLPLSTLSLSMVVTECKFYAPMMNIKGNVIVIIF